MAIIRETVSRLRATPPASPVLGPADVRRLMLQLNCLSYIFKESSEHGDKLTAQHVALQMVKIAERTKDIHCTIAAYTCMIRLGHISDDFALASQYEAS